MTTISAFMQHNHRQCDELYAAAEEAVAHQDWAAADVGWLAFASELNTHITNREEGLLFPALEAANGPAGPISVMRMEHEQMRVLVAQMNEALAAREQQRFLGLGETLMMLTQQHNMKEENILYPIMDQLIAGEAENLPET
jgi:iron-sulfur cluster repair protein YtfE (RIC family)